MSVSPMLLMKGEFGKVTVKQDIDAMKFTDKAGVSASDAVGHPTSSHKKCFQFDSVV